jgi:predicted PolB exonuclease-like 3'-5' exonuclease
MIKSIADEVWAFDCEWIPDLQAGRILYKQPDEISSKEVLETMWEYGGKTPENPQPFLKLIQCRIVSIATVIRRVLRNGDVQLFLFALPQNINDETQDEATILRRFLLEGLAIKNPQLVGFNSRNSDLRILLQRAIIHGIDIKALAERLQAKPWESQDVDLMELVSGFGKNTSVSLNELAQLSGIPGKLDTTGDDVCGLWYAGKRQEIINYNCFDALTTYLVWLRMAFVSGKFTKEEYRIEQVRVRRLIEEHAQKPGESYLLTYLDAWRDLKQRTVQVDGVFE